MDWKLMDALTSLLLRVSLFIRTLSKKYFFKGSFCDPIICYFYDIVKSAFSDILACIITTEILIPNLVKPFLDSTKMKQLKMAIFLLGYALLLYLLSGVPHLNDSPFIITQEILISNSSLTIWIHYYACIAYNSIPYCVSLIIFTI